MNGSAFLKDSIPVVTESKKDYEGFRMGRCNYLTVQCDAPSPGWQLELENQLSSYLMLGLTGVISHPFGGNLFESVQQIEDLFNRIEQREELSLDVDDLWIPYFVLWRTPDQFRSGQVFRISEELFGKAYAYREGLIEQEAYLSYCQQIAQEAITSDVESKSFADWHWEQVNAVRDVYRSNKEKGLVLPRVAPKGTTS